MAWPPGRAEAGRRANAAGRRANAALELHIRSRHLLVHIEEFTPEPLHIFIRQLLLLIQEIMHGHFPE